MIENHVLVITQRATRRWSCCPPSTKHTSLTTTLPCQPHFLSTHSALATAWTLSYSFTVHASCSPSAGTRVYSPGRLGGRRREAASLTKASPFSFDGPTTGAGTSAFGIGESSLLSFGSSKGADLHGDSGSGSSKTLLFNFQAKAPDALEEMEGLVGACCDCVSTAVHARGSAMYSRHARCKRVCV